MAGILALGLNAPPLLATAEYTQFSTRGKSELLRNPDGSLKEKTGGLSTDYITQFSYGIFESLNLMAPRIQGGGSSEDLGEDSELFDFLIQKMDCHALKPKALFRTFPPIGEVSPYSKPPPMWGSL